MALFKVLRRASSHAAVSRGGKIYHTDEHGLFECEEEIAKQFASINPDYYSIVGPVEVPPPLPVEVEPLPVEPTISDTPPVDIIEVPGPRVVVDSPVEVKPEIPADNRAFRHNKRGKRY